MVRKREDGRWEGRIVVGHKENGEPIFRYVLAKTQKELLAKLHRDMDIYQDAQLTEDSRMTLGEWLDCWMEEYGAVTLRPNTLRSYEQYIRCYVKPYLGGKIVSRVTRLDIQKLYRKLKKEGRVHDHPEYGHELSDSMVLRIHAMLHRCLKDAERDHIVPYNPTDGVKLPKSNYKPKQVLDREQMDAFLAAVDKNEIWRDFFYTELTTGLRRGEICGLTLFPAGSQGREKGLHTRRSRPSHRLAHWVYAGGDCPAEAVRCELRRLLPQRPCPEPQPHTDYGQDLRRPGGGD